MTKIDVQNMLLRGIQQGKILVTVYLTNGFQLRGTIKNHDNYMVEMESEGKQQLIYKHAISTIIPVKAIKINEDLLK